MALLDTAGNITNLGDILAFGDKFLQQNVRIRKTSASSASPIQFNNPLKPNENEVFFNVVQDETLTYKVTISEKPVGDLGATIDYISRESTPLVLTTIISNRAFNVLDDPLGALENIASSIAPVSSNLINQGASIASKFFDLGSDAIDKKIQLLRQWQTTGEIVQVLGARLDVYKHVSTSETFNFLIEEIALSYSKTFGDSVGLTITLKNVLGLEDITASVGRGAKLKEAVSGALSAINPFD